MRQMTEVSFESGQSVVFHQANMPARNMANPLCPPEQTNSGQQKCKHTKTIQIRAGDAKAAAKREIGEIRESGGKPGRKWIRKWEREKYNRERKKKRMWWNEKVKVEPRPWFRFEMSFVGRHISSLPTPALIVDKEKVIGKDFIMPGLFFGTPSRCSLSLHLDVNYNFIVWGKLPKDAWSSRNEQDLSASSDQNPQDGGGRRSAGITWCVPSK